MNNLELFTTVVLFAVVGNLLTAASANIGQFVEGKYELALDSKRNGFVEHLQVLDVSPGNIVKLQKLTRVEVIKVDENTVKYKLSSPEMPQFVSEALIEFGKITLGTFIDGRPYKSIFEIDDNIVTEEASFPNATTKCRYSYQAEGFHVTCITKDKIVSRFYMRVATK